MRIVLLLSVLFISGSVFAQTYRSGGTYKANFGSQQATEGDKKPSAPGAKSNIKTRTFTSYGARQQWGKGVQTQAVQTSTAATAAPEPVAEAQLSAAEQKLDAAAKKAAPAPKAASARGAAQPAASSQAPAEQQQPAMPAEAAAAMQQIQGMQEMLKSLGGAAGGAAQPGAAGAMPAGMNVPGMPDMSALMGAAAAGKQPKK